MTVNNDKNQRIRESLSKILDESSFDIVFKFSVVHIYPSRRRSTALLMLGTFLLTLLTYSNNPINLIENIPLLVEKSNSIVLGLLAMIITGYTIFQAMLSTPALKIFLSTHSNEKSIFSNYQHCFFSLALLYILILVFNYLVICLFVILPNILNIFNIFVLNLLSTLYILFVLNSLIEMKSFLYNFYQTLSLSAIAKTIDDLHQEEKH